jgi:hypothetical protein
MVANGASTVEPSHEMLLRSHGPVDQLDTTRLSPAGSYVRSYNKNGQSNVNASYNTVSLQIKEKRRKLVMTIVACLGNNPRYWFEDSLRPAKLPVRPLDWSTTLLKQLRIFAESLPCDPRNTTVEQRLCLAHQKMLAEASRSNDCSANSVSMQQTDESFQERNEQDDLHQSLLNKIQGMKEEIDELLEEQKKNVEDLEVYEDRLRSMPAFDLEVLRVRERFIWMESYLATKREQATNDQVQAAISELERAFSFS